MGISEQSAPIHTAAVQIGTLSKKYSLPRRHCRGWLLPAASIYRAAQVPVSRRWPAISSRRAVNCSSRIYPPCRICRSCSSTAATRPSDRSSSSRARSAFTPRRSMTIAVLGR